MRHPAPTAPPHSTGLASHLAAGRGDGAQCVHLARLEGAATQAKPVQHADGAVGVVRTLRSGRGRIGASIAVRGAARITTRPSAHRAALCIPQWHENGAACGDAVPSLLPFHAHWPTARATPRHATPSNHRTACPGVQANGGGQCEGVGGCECVSPQTRWSPSRGSCHASPAAPPPCPPPQSSAPAPSSRSARGQGGGGRKQLKQVVGTRPTRSTCAPPDATTHVCDSGVDVAHEHGAVHVATRTASARLRLRRVVLLRLRRLDQDGEAAAGARLQR